MASWGSMLKLKESEVEVEVEGPWEWGQGDRKELWREILRLSIWGEGFSIGGGV